MLGDVCITGKYEFTNAQERKAYFSEATCFLSDHDYVIANLEAPLTDSETTYTCKGLHLKSSTKSVETLKALHINVVGLANNHIYDYGDTGFKDTLDTLNKNGIMHYGVSGRTLYLENSHSKIAMSGYCCYSTNPTNCNSRCVNPLEPKGVLKNIQHTAHEGFLNIVSLHWGDENIHYPRTEHISFARMLADQTNIVLHGNHPHVIQGIEEYGSSLLAYSLGNFITDDITSKAVRNLAVRQKPENKKSIVLTLDIQNNKLVNHQITPIVDDGMHLLVGDSATLEDLSLYSKKLLDDPKEYYQFRQHELTCLSQSSVRKKSFQWFLNRLNYYFIGAVVKGFLSKYKYRRCFKEQLPSENITSF